MFKTKTIAGVPYSLGHLAPFYFSVVCKNSTTNQDVTYKVKVQFSSHCFTEEFIEGQHGLDLAYTFGGEKRAFCMVRYGFSHKLKQIIEDLVFKRPVYASDTSGAVNYFVLRTADQGDYAVYFSLVLSGDRSDADVVMLVRSAYIKDAAPEQAPTVPFNTLVEKTARRQKVVHGKRDLIKKRPLP